jgi:hypothetical protein
MAESTSDELVYVGKDELEFFDTDTIPWSPLTRRPGVSERILARDPSHGLLTRMVRWEPGLDTSSAGPVAHDYFEEVLILSGSLQSWAAADVQRGLLCLPTAGDGARPVDHR